ncbi:hypothetical protein GCM10008968_23940 [Bacillus horti]
MSNPSLEEAFTQSGQVTLSNLSCKSSYVLQSESIKFENNHGIKFYTFLDCKKGASSVSPAIGQTYGAPFVIAPLQAK